MITIFVRIAAICMAALVLSIVGFIAGFDKERLTNISGLLMMAAVSILVLDGIVAMLWFAFQ